MSETDTSQPVQGILDLRDNSAFIRAEGYLAGPTDTHVPMPVVRRHRLRRGDHITGRGATAARSPRDAPTLVRVDTINGLNTVHAEGRPGFDSLTPLHPAERLLLETKPDLLSTRIIDLIMPLGKGQRALLVSPPKVGKTTTLQAIANAIATNHPEAHLMMLLVDERPEEVTDMRRTVAGDIIAATFDRPSTEHTALAELAVERAKRLVEHGRDVVLLVDSLTRLGRAHNLTAKNSGRILSGGVDASALQPVKQLLGAARNVEHGGSLTIFATAMVENGSVADTVMFEELKATGNAELKLDRGIAERRTFPAVDILSSGTRREELLLAPDELLITQELHRLLPTQDKQHALDQLLGQLRATRTNAEFLMRIASATTNARAAA